MSVATDVQRQINADRSWPTHSARSLLTVRLRALAGAHRAHQAGDPDALYVIRQSLVDVAAAAAEAADELR